MRALRLSDKLELVRDAPLPRHPQETLVQVICAGICNTDLEITKGYAGFEGTLGHEFVGRVVESPRAELIGRRVAGEINVGCGACPLCKSGDSRHCPSRSVLGIKGRDGAFADYLSLPDANLFEVPDSIDDTAAVFLEPLAAALHILDAIEIDHSTQVAIVGDGKLAQLVIRSLTTTGCDITAIGKHESKLSLARVAGARAVPLSDAERERGAFDVVIDASGSASGISLAIELVKPTGTIILKSTHHGSTTLSLTPVVVNELRIAGSRCGRLGPAIEAMSRGSIDVTSLISAVASLDDGPQAFARAGEPGAMKVILRMS
jgi:threonine dehydrogenase-like Zn-dependent dehydrogenase